MLLASQPCSSTLTPHYSSTCSSPLATATAASAPRSSRTCSPMRPTSRSCSPSRRRTASHSGGCSVYDRIRDPKNDLLPAHPWQLERSAVNPGHPTRRAAAANVVEASPPIRLARVEDMLPTRRASDVALFA
jgi:hypothetical protein